MKFWIDKTRGLLAPDTGDPVEGLGEVFVEEEHQEEEELYFIDGLDDIPVEKPTAPGETPEMKVLREQNEALSAQNTTLQERVDPVVALQQGIADLGNSLRPAQGQQASETTVDPEEEKKKFNDDFYNDPYGMLSKFQMQKLAPEFQKIAQTNTAYAKEFLMMDPEKVKVYKKYGPEVEEVFQALPPEKKFTNPNAYKEAADIVSFRHIDETREDMKASLKEEILAELKLDPAAGNEKRPPVYSESGVTSGAGNKGGGKQIVVPAAVWDFAAKKGLQGDRDAESKARVYRLWKDGKLRVPGVPYERKGA